nr:MAG TPA: TOM7 family [Caudoviricetes sp.]
MERLMGVEPCRIANRWYFLPFILYIMLLGILHFGFCYRLKTKSVYF